MTRLFNPPSDFADEAIAGFVAANERYVRRVHGGVVRSTTSPRGQVAVVVGGGSGHYPAFTGWVGPGFAHGAAAGNVFASPSAAQIHSVAVAADNGGGVILGYGNYTGDVLHFGLARDQLVAEGIDARVMAITDDVASSDTTSTDRRRGVAGDLPVFKIACAAAEAGLGIDEVMRVARAANAATRSFGVAFDGCTLPGAERPLFELAEGRMALGLGIHGEAGIDERPVASAHEVARLLVDAITTDRPPQLGDRVAVLLNGLGTVKYEELFVVYRSVAQLLAEAGLTVVEPEVGEFVTSLDMAGLSLTLTWLDAELEGYWGAPVDTPAYTKGAGASRERVGEQVSADITGAGVVVGSTASREAAQFVLRLLGAVSAMLTEHQDERGALDAVAGDGDHGAGMARGARSAVLAAERAVAEGAGLRTMLRRAGEAWAEHAGGTSGALWGACLTAAAGTVSDDEAPSAEQVATGAQSALDALVRLGGAQLGDKTMVDATIPFVQTLRAGIDARHGAVGAWRAAAATAAAEATRSLSPRLGRARPLAARSIGHRDPGAVSFALIVTTVGDGIAPDLR